MLRVGHRRKARTIEPPIWPARRGRARVLVENPDGAEIWAHTEALREAGYDVAICFGPSADARVVCPLVSEGRCAAVEDADVVISTTSLDDDGAVVAALCSRHPKGLIIEGAEAGDLPIEQSRLLSAVETALADGLPDHDSRRHQAVDRECVAQLSDAPLNQQPNPPHN